MKSYRDNPDGEENQKASRQIDREIFALKMQAKREAEAGREEEEDDETGERRREMSIIRPDAMTPREIVEHARALQEYFEKQGHRTWQFMGVCSRDHAVKVAVFRTALEFYAKESNWFGAPAPVYQDSGAIARTTLELLEEP